MYARNKAMLSSIQEEISRMNRNTDAIINQLRSITVREEDRQNVAEQTGNRSREDLNELRKARVKIEEVQGLLKTSNFNIRNFIDQS